MKVLNTEDYARTIIHGEDRRVLITPQLAEEFLKRNNNNRKINYTYVNSYAKLMKEGKWDKTGQAISFNTDGELEDGQHRLKAIVMSGVPIEMMASTQNKVNGVYDEGRKRTVRDFARRYFKEDDSRYSNGRFIATINSVIRVSGESFNRRVTSTDTTEFISNHQLLCEQFLNTIPLSASKIVSTPVRVALFLALANGQSVLKLRSFYDVLLTGYMKDDSETAIIALRNWIISLPTKTGETVSNEIMRRTQFALKKYIDGKSYSRCGAVKELIWNANVLK